VARLNFGIDGLASFVDVSDGPKASPIGQGLPGSILGRCRVCGCIYSEQGLGVA
jgi:hypothetical protein